MEGRAANGLGATVGACAAGLALVVAMVVQTLGPLPGSVLGRGHAAPGQTTFQAAPPRVLGALQLGETQVLVQLPLFTPTDRAAELGDRYGL
ncbi:MAG TPA: hypothetical protein VGK42_03055, partial [Candidatus Dormibacteraeota bacterium]